MEIITLISQIGLPGWVVIFASLIWLFNSVGLLNPFKEAVRAITQEQTAAREFVRQQQRDQQEAIQDRQAQSLNQVIEINQTLINSITSVVDAQISMLREIRAAQITILGKIDITTREWSRLEEVLSDVDIYMHEIKQEIAACAIANQRNTAEVDRLRQSVNNLASKEKN